MTLKKEFDIAQRIAGGLLEEVERRSWGMVFYEHPEVKDYRFGFNVGRDEPIDPLLRIFEADGKVKIVRTGKVLRIQRGR